MDVFTNSVDHVLKSVTLISALIAAWSPGAEAFTGKLLWENDIEGKRLVEGIVGR